MGPREWVQLLFALSNGLSFLLTIRHSWRAKIAGSAVLIIAHPMVATYFLMTGQPIFILGNTIMTCAGVYGVLKGLKLRKEIKDDAAQLTPRTFTES